jgi:tetratricopeptide (TPR) repeat protein
MMGEPVLELKPKGQSDRFAPIYVGVRVRAWPAPPVARIGAPPWDNINKIADRLTCPVWCEKIIPFMPGKNSTRKKPGKADRRDLDTVISFMEGLVRRDPDYVDALEILGDTYTQRGRFADGLRVDERLARLAPENPIVFYNLACSYSLTDEFDRAAFALDYAIKLGYHDFKWLTRDPDLKKLRAQPVFRELRKKIRQLAKPAQ